ncbi:MAG TPA: RHS repeat-associated core domain-containing protein [Rhizomicrobium sp.]|jgi:RHS repeat-associated protein
MTSPQNSENLSPLAGDFAVDMSGSGTCDYPLDLPPGTAGLLPKLSLNYNGSRGQGLLGVGWAVTGLSSITRVPCTVAQDGEAAGALVGINGQPPASFALDGARLIEVKIGKYRTELNKGDIAFLERDSDGAEHWTVATKDGLRMEYGGVASARVMSVDGSHMAIWALNRVIDRCGNYYTIDYDQDDGADLRPTAINYTGYSFDLIATDPDKRAPPPPQTGKPADLAPQRRIDFTYAKTSSPIVLYSQGAKSTGQYVVQNITTSVPGDAGTSRTVSSWSFEYQTSGVSGRPLLMSIAGPKGLVRFDYPPAPASLSQAGVLPLVTDKGVPYGFVSNLQGARLLPADFTGDGKTDLFYVTADALSGKILTVVGVTGIGDGEYQPAIVQSLSTPDHGWLAWSDFLWATTADVDNDGLVELIIAVQNPYQLLVLKPAQQGDLLTLTQIGSYPINDGALAKSTMLPVSLTGDGTTSLAYTADGGQTVTFLQADAGAHGTVNLSPLGQVGAWPLASDNGKGELFPIDIDGDGRTHFVRAWSNGTTLSLAVVRVTASPMGPVSFAVINRLDTLLPYPGCKVLIGDINGDGLNDIVWVGQSKGAVLQVAHFLNTGSGSFQQVKPGSGTSEAADVPVAFAHDALTAMFAGLAPESAATMGSRDQGWDDTFSDQAPSLIADALLHLETTSFFTGACDNWLKIDYSLADVDGDGRAELVAVARVNYSGPGEMTDDSFHLAWHVEPVADFWLAGYRSDGGALSVTRLGGAAPAVIATNWLLNITEGGASMVLDLEGRGKAGLVYIQGVPGNDFSGSFFYVTTPASPVDLLQSITNELGGTVSVAYKQLNDPLVHSGASAARGAQMLEAIAGAQFLKDQSSTPRLFDVLRIGAPAIVGSPSNLRSIAMPRYVAASYTRDLGGVPCRTDCFYSGGRFDMAGRGWLGFDTVRFAEPGLGTIRETCHAQLFPFTGQVLCSSLQQGDSAQPGDLNPVPVLHGTILAYGEIAGTPPGIHLVMLDHSIEIWTDGHLLTERKTVQLTHNGWGDLIQSVEEVEQCMPDGPIKPVSKIVKNFAFSYPVLRNPDGPLAVLPQASVNWAIWAVSQPTRAEQRDGADTALVTRDYSYRADNGLLATMRDGDSPLHLVSHEYDLYGNRTKTTDALGTIVQTEYDNVFNTFAVTTKRGDVVNESFAWDAGFGRITKKTDANGVATLYAFDEFGRLISVQAQPDAATTVDLIQRSYAGQGVANFDEQVAVGGGNWLQRSRRCDTWGRLSQESADAPDGGTTQTSYAYDSRNNVVLQTQTKGAGVSLAVHRDFDLTGRAIGETVTDSCEANPITTSWQWQSSWQCLEECANSAATLQYATFNDQRKLTARSTGANETTTWRYDALGRVLDVVDPAGTVTSSRYDIFGRVVQVSYASEKGVLLQRETIVFDDATRSLTRSDLASEQVKRAIRESLDARGRIVTRALQAADGSTTLNSWTWDADVPGGQDRLASATVECQMLQADGTAAKAGRISAEYRYDWRGRPATITHSYATDGATTDSFTFAYEHTLAGDIASVTYPNNARQTNSFTPRGSLESILFQPPTGDPTRIAAFDWSSANGATARSVCFGNGAVETTQISLQGRIVSRELCQGSAMLESWSIVRDAFGNPTSIGDRSYTYGTPPRLTGAIVPGTDPYSYHYVRGDRIDDRLGATFDAHRVVQLGSNPVNYDASGNMTGLPALTPGAAEQNFTYDALGQLIAANGTSAGVQFAALYDPFGRRAMKQLTSTGRSYLQRSIDPCYEVTDYVDGAAKTTQTAIVIMGPTGPIAQWADNAVSASLGRALQAGISYLHTDHVGSVTRVTDALGEALATISYSPFGEILSESAHITRRLYTGHEYDDEIGLHYMGARYYHPRLGIFVQPDDRPGGPPASNDAYNRYAYAANLPLTFIDPTGHGFIEHLLNSIGLGFLNDGTFKVIVIFSCSYGLIIAGVLVTAFTAGLGIVIGAGLMGAGIAGLVYAVSTIAQHEDLSYDSWAIQLGIGAVTGVATAGAEAAVSAVYAGVVEGMTVATTATTMARMFTNVLAAAEVSLATGVIQNAIFHRDLADGLWLGVVTSAASAIAFGAGNGLESAPADNVLSKAYRAVKDAFAPLTGVWKEIGPLNQNLITTTVKVEAGIMRKVYF